MSADAILFTDIVDYIFIGIFTLEAVIKIVAFGKAYFKEGWNRFDFGLVVIILGSIFLGETFSMRFLSQG